MVVPVVDTPRASGSLNFPAVSSDVFVDTVDTFGLVAIGMSLTFVALRLIKES